MSASNLPEHASLQAAVDIAGPGKYLTYGLGRERYGMSILNVQEIRSYEKPTRLAGAAHYVKGVINLRGTIVPLVDMRELFGREADINEATVVVVINVRNRTLGVIVDAVHDVADLASTDIRHVPECGPTGLSRHMRGITTKGGEMVILIDMKSLLTDSTGAPEEF